jgi:hypothetical protein
MQLSALISTPITLGLLSFPKQATYTHKLINFSLHFLFGIILKSLFLDLSCALSSTAVIISWQDRIYLILTINNPLPTNCIIPLLLAIHFLIVVFHYYHYYSLKLIFLHQS